LEGGLFSETREKRESRAKKIRQAENQLSKAATTFESFSEDSQSEETLPSTKMPDNDEKSEKRMVAPGSRDAPRFNSSSPGGLRRFIARMEDLWKDAGVTKDNDKKTMIGKYADMDSEEEWAAFDSFDKGSWDQFKKELIANYPESAAAARGTPARIRQLCANTAKIKLGDLETLCSFKRTFSTEARKLQTDPAAMANRELVELFISCLTESFAQAVLQYLGNRVSDSTSTTTGEKEKEKDGTSDSPKPAKAPRRPEDKYDLADVCNAAIKVSENSQGMFSLMRKESSSKSSEREVFVFNQPSSESKGLSDK
jgi:hypothetical protein